jgi:nicotinamide-nucleotide amidase
VPVGPDVLVAHRVVNRAVRRAEILAIGSELLTPFRTDTNSLYLTARLNDIGIDVVGKSIVADDRAAMESALRGALARADIVLTTGGLGPTDDDLTRDAIRAVAGVDADEDPAVIAAIEARFARRGWPMPAINRRQAQVPRGAEVLDNPNGTAPGLWMPIGGNVVVALPGPPRELQPMYDNHVEPRLRARTGRLVLRRRTLKTAGRGESHVEELAQPLYALWREIDPAISTTILAAPGQVELHLSAQGDDPARLDAALDAAVTALQGALGSIVVSVDGRSLEEVVGALLQKQGLMLAGAESCTGGLMLGRLTDVPGSSAWVAGGVVAYANSVKTETLGVPRDLIEAHGAVSEPVAAAMAAGVRVRLQAGIGVGITGIAGPGGGTDAKPVGTVAIAVAGPGDRRVVRTLRLPGDRAMVRQLAVQAALDLVRRMLTDADYN